MISEYPSTNLTHFTIYSLNSEYTSSNLTQSFCEELILSMEKPIVKRSLTGNVDLTITSSQINKNNINNSPTINMDKNKYETFSSNEINCDMVSY